MLYLRRECFHHSSIFLCDKPSRTHRTAPLLYTLATGCMQSNISTRLFVAHFRNEKYYRVLIIIIISSSLSYGKILRFFPVRFSPSLFGSVHGSYLDSNGISKSIMFSVWVAHSLSFSYLNSQCTSTCVWCRFQIIYSSIDASAAVAAALLFILFVISLIRIYRWTKYDTFIDSRTQLEYHENDFGQHIHESVHVRHLHVILCVMLTCVCLCFVCIVSILMVCTNVSFNRNRVACKDVGCRMYLVCVYTIHTCECVLV